MVDGQRLLLRQAFDQADKEQKGILK